MADHIAVAARWAWAGLRAAVRAAGAYLDRVCTNAVESLFCRAWGLPRPGCMGGMSCG